MPDTTFIYALCEPGTRKVRYIGKTSTTPQKRLKRHLKESIKLETHLGRWLRQIVSCGAVPSLVVFREVPGNGSEAEKRYIRLARGCRMDLVNGTEGGDGGTPTPETRAKLSAASSGENNPMFGRTHSEEARALQGAATRGEKNSQFGKPRSEEEKSRQSAAMLGDKNHQFGKTGAANPTFGRKHTDEEKAKMKAAWARRKAAKV